VIKFVTAVVSLTTVVALAPVIPRALTLRSPERLEREVQQRTRELELARQQATSIVEASPTGMLMIDKLGQIVLVNAVAERLFGYERAALLGQPVEMLLPERFRGNHPQLRNAFFAAPEARRMGAGRDLFGRRADGSEFPIEIGLNPVDTGCGLFVLSAIVDITERKRTEDRIRHANEALQQSNTDLEQFAYVASHDLQEPLRKISAYAELLREECGKDLSPAGDEYLDVMINGADRLKTMISDLLSFARITTRGNPLAPTDAEMCLQAALQNLEMAIDESNARVTWDPLPHVIADESQLILLFQNLVGNAIKYRREGVPEIHIGARDADTHFEFFVQDNGIGIEAEFHQRIFEVFQRLHHRSEYSGTGIGLAVSKRIAERLGGRIWVASTPGKGSTFFFTISKTMPTGAAHQSIALEVVGSPT
jgi:PAS domain S-box-containing protein